MAKLTATDRKALAKITEGRFEILHEQLATRRTEIRETAEKNIVDAHKAEIEKITTKLHALAEERAELSQLQTQFEADRQTLRLEHEAKINAKSAALDTKQNKIDTQAEDQGLTVKRDRYGAAGNFKVAVADINESVNSKFSNVLAQYNAARLNLDTMKLQTLERIAVSGLESAEAEDFMTTIPIIDDLLPAPEALKELLA